PSPLSSSSTSSSNSSTSLGISSKGHSSMGSSFSSLSSSSSSSISSSSSTSSRNCPSSLLPPPPVSQQQPFPTWTAGSAASAAHLSGASPAPSAGGSVTAFPSSGFVGLLGQPESVASPMYPSSANETSFQYSASPSSTIDFVLDSGATDTVLRDDGTLRPLPTPTSLLGADSSFSIPCHNTSTLPCPLFPSGTVTGLHIPSLRTNLLSQRSLQQAMITTLIPGGPNH
ncbi:unnamed protein product, partial [Closterium sp. NIES-54]